MLLLCVLALVGLIAADCTSITGSDEPEYGTGKYCLTRSGDSYQITQKFINEDNCFVVAYYDHGIIEKKADRFWLRVNKSASDNVTDEDMARAAGYMEGVVTSYAIANHFVNVREDYYHEDENGNMGFDPKLKEYSKTQKEFIEKMYEDHQNDKWWKQAHLMLVQLEGLADGFASTETSKSINPGPNETSYLMPFYYVNMAGEYDDLPGWFYPEVTQAKDYNPDIHEHCTASVVFNKNLGNTADPDIYFSQDSWSGYNSLYRIMKSYNIPYEGVKAQHIVFSSYPIQLFSMDDIYVLDTKLAVYETTFHTWTLDLYNKYLKPQTVPTWIRVQIANRMAVDGRSWARTFRRYNSGTYNNQYVILDYNKFETYLNNKDNKNTDLLKNTAYIIEMGPGMAFEYDSTRDLNDPKIGYIPGINTPRPKLMFDYQGYPSQQSDPVTGYWGYEKGARFNLFEKYVGRINDPEYDAKTDPELSTKERLIRVTDYTSFQTFKRYNNFKSEPLAHVKYDPDCKYDKNNCNKDVYEPSFAILSRYDQRQTGTTHGPNGFGGLDAKTTNYKNVIGMTFDFKPCPHDTTDNENEGNPEGTDFFISNWNFNSWNTDNQDAQVMCHGLEPEEYTCSWISMNGLEH